MKVPKRSNPLMLLQARLGEEWPAINRARTRAGQTGKKLEETVKGLSSSDASIVVFGSLARAEWTSKSDVDWTMLIDGQADPQHLEMAQNVAARLKKAKFAEPGTTGIFGNMTFSHDLVQKIGGREDTNENTTRRVLLLQESAAFGKPDAHERVLRLILSRYLNDDWGFKYGRLPMKVPRFLLNDIVRYWRTLPVDFVDKHSTVPMEEHLRNFIRNTPLEILATFVLELKIRPKTTMKLFSSYNSFLALLNNEGKRNHLKKLRPEDIRSDKVFNEVRKFGRDFQDGLTALFFQDNEQLRRLTIFYGMF